jgi:flagellar L-ring protein precursor FlgH
MRSYFNLVLLILLPLCLGGCYTMTRLTEVGDKPPLTPTQDPTAFSGYQQVRMPMPPPRKAQYANNSLWREGATSFFRDQRASRVGDSLVVLISKTNVLNMRDTTETDRQTSMNANVGNFFNLRQKGIGKGNFLSLGAQPQLITKNRLKKTDTLSFRLTATITQVLPNGNLVIMGRQEFRVDFETREVVVSGVVRPEDISLDNTVDFDKLAEARVSYGGRGQLSDNNRAPYGQDLMTNIMPF